MFTDISSVFLLLVIITVVAFAIYSFIGKKSLLTPLLKIKTTSALQYRQAENDFPPPLIDRPMVEFDDNASIAIEKRPMEIPKLEMVEDEETTLLKAAEVVVEKVQDVVNHIASNPPNSEEVFSKIKAIICHYTIFHNTDYFDAINSFIAVTIERDCGIRLTKEKLLQLWES